MSNVQGGTAIPLIYDAVPVILLGMGTTAHHPLWHSRKDVTYCLKLGIQMPVGLRCACRW